ncbi:MBL fold metallo-hydrolase [Diplocloster modestus]|uniref:MBL fold metallo-hydrolase n=1 Tax=Diplocloster modestus TaxID=2850322 RepID=A0ABS6KDQ7_9FIRM|nr:MBL fold metallo-hydrolase [Diplocloster modestus]MBU9728661.1 MBL fold metallo-hydrolase [Diplocloster modestus]
MSDWFTIDHIDKDTHIISEYRHWEETHAYLLNGSTHSLLIDTGLGIENIYEEVIKLTAKPVIAVATHIHWDHIGGHRYFPEFYAHEDEVHWLTGEFPLTVEQIKAYVVERCDLPENFNVDNYEFFQGTPVRVLKDQDLIDIGDRTIQVLHTPGHSPGHMCFYEEASGYLFTGDLVYKDTLFAYYPSTDPAAYLASIERIAVLPVKKVFPAHHDLNVQPALIQDMKNAFTQLKVEGRLHHGSGIFKYKDFSIWI